MYEQRTHTRQFSLQSVRLVKTVRTGAMRDAEPNRQPTVARAPKMRAREPFTPRSRRARASVFVCVQRVRD